MSEYIPTLDEVRDKYADARVGIGEWTRFDESVKQAVESAYAEFDRMIAEVESAAAVKALTDAAEATEEESPGEPHAGATFAAHAAWLRARAEAYRQERGEQ